MSKERLIFLTNDDSYLSKGFRAAVELAKEFGHVVAIAPDRVQSGMSQAITINLRLLSLPKHPLSAFRRQPLPCPCRGWWRGESFR